MVSIIYSRAFSSAAAGSEELSMVTVIAPSIMKQLPASGDVASHAP